MIKDSMESPFGDPFDAGKNRGLDVSQGSCGLSPYTSNHCGPSKQEFLAGSCNPIFIARLSHETHKDTSALILDVAGTDSVRLCLRPNGMQVP